MISGLTKKTPTYYVLLLMLIAILLAPLELLASDIQPSQVEVEGYASIVNSRKDQAREAAIQNALRRAVEQVVGVAIESRTVVKDSELLNDKIFSKSRGLIKTYRIVSEKAEKDAYRVTILASVSRYRLEKELDDAGVLIRKLGRPRTAVVIMEQNLDAPSAPGGIVETYLLSSLGRKGYNIVDRQAMLAIEKVAVRSGADHTDAVVRAAAAGGAEVVVVGQAQARQGNAVPGMSMRPVQVSSTCKVLDVDTSEVLATASVSKQALNVNPSAAGTEALQAAAAEISDNLDRQLLSVWNNRLSGLRNIRLAISGVHFGATGRIMETIREKSGLVEDVQERGFKAGELRLELSVTGSSRAVVDELAALDFAGCRLSITGFSGGQIHARCPVKQQSKRGKK